MSGMKASSTSKVYRGLIGTSGLLLAVFMPTLVHSEPQTVPQSGTYNVVDQDGATGALDVDLQRGRAVWRVACKKNESLPLLVLAPVVVHPGGLTAGKYEFNVVGNSLFNPEFGKLYRNGKTKRMFGRLKDCLPMQDQALVAE